MFRLKEQSADERLLDADVQFTSSGSYEYRQSTQHIGEALSENQY